MRLLIDSDSSDSLDRVKRPALLIALTTLLFGGSASAQTFKVRVGGNRASTTAAAAPQARSRAEQPAPSTASPRDSSACARFAGATWDQRFPKGHGAAVVALAVACKLDPNLTYVEAARGIALEPPNPIFAAAQTALCDQYLPRGSYLVWRHCKALLSEVDPALPTAVVQAGDPTVQSAFLARVAGVRQQLEELAPKMREHEQGYPGDKLFFDDAWKQVKQGFEPRLRNTRRQLAEIFAWQEQVAKGPGFAGDCVPRFNKMLADYVRSVVAKPKSNELVEVMRDPIGSQIAEALAICHERKSNGFDSDADAIRSRILPLSTRRAWSNSDALVGWLSLPRTSKLYKNQATDLSARDTYDIALPSPFGEQNIAGDGEIGLGTPVASVTTAKGKALLKFKRIVEVNHIAANCHATNRLSYIDAAGHAVYEQDCKGTKRVVDDFTQAPITVPLADARKITVGSTVEFSARSNSGDARIRFVHNRAGDMVYAVGITLDD
jgi:hypothetical protein